MTVNNLDAIDMSDDKNHTTVIMSDVIPSTIAFAAMLEVYYVATVQYST